MAQNTQFNYVIPNDQIQTYLGLVSIPGRFEMFNSRDMPVLTTEAIELMWRYDVIRIEGGRFTCIHIPGTEGQ